MVASLGWMTLDHLHIHCVPTFQDDVTRGFENFNGTWRCVDIPARQLCTRLNAKLASVLGAQ